MSPPQYALEEDLPGVRDRMFRHMQGYDRIFHPALPEPEPEPGDDTVEYELVQIPKPLLLRAADCWARFERP